AVPNTVVEFDEDDFSFLKMHRHQQAEQGLANFLKERGLQSADNIFFKPAQCNTEMLPCIVRWLNNNSQILVSKGFEVHAQFNQQQFYAHDFELKFNFIDDRDWFDVHSYVYFKGFKIPFIALKKNILNQVKEYELPNGQIFVIPNEWFAKFKNLFDFSEEDGDGLKLKKQHFTILDKLEGINKKLLNKLSKADLSKADYAVPPGIKAVLRPYQAEGYSWMYHVKENKFGACLADDMGLGKTLQTLALLQQVIEESSQATTQATDQLPLNGQLSLFEDFFGRPGNPPKQRPALLLCPPRWCITG
ncbi:MAG: DEAD/DEAH box helicase, partial [Bacteroidales bacterium]|nr:DEAD/DEAH box helicase [Bacteroidales bacterium]